MSGRWAALPFTFAVSFVAATCAVQCCEIPPPVPPVYVPYPDAGYDRDELEEVVIYRGKSLARRCAEACANFRVLGCPEAEKRPDEDACEDLCVTTVGTGKIALDLDCVATARTVAQVRRCNARCFGK